MGGWCADGDFETGGGAEEEGILTSAGAASSSGTTALVGQVMPSMTQDLIALILYLSRWHNEGCSPVLMRCWTTLKQDWWPQSSSSRSVDGALGFAVIALSTALCASARFVVDMPSYQFCYMYI